MRRSTRPDGSGPACRTALVSASCTMRYAAAPTAGGTAPNRPECSTRAPAWRAAFTRSGTPSRPGSGPRASPAPCSRSTQGGAEFATGRPAGVGDAVEGLGDGPPVEPAGVGGQDTRRPSRTSTAGSGVVIAISAASTPIMPTGPMPLLLRSAATRHSSPAATVPEEARTAGPQPRRAQCVVAQYVSLRPP
ncbi:hypothetical protein ACVW19_002092 [Streptomyces sp. TE5632]